MFKFIEFRNFELFEHFLNECPPVEFSSRQRLPKLQFPCESEQINPIIQVKTEYLPSNDPIVLMHCTMQYIWLASSTQLQVYDISMQQTKLIKRIDIPGVLAICSTSDCCLVVQCGQILILENFVQIANYKFETAFPFTMIRMMDQSLKSLDYYEILLADNYGNCVKLHCNIYKLFSKRTVKFNNFPLLMRGAPIEQSKNSSQWWIEKSQEFKIVYQNRKSLFEMLVLQGEEKFSNAFVFFQFESSIDIYKVAFGLKDTIQLVHRIMNEDHEPGYACLGRGYIESLKNLICCSYGQSIHLFSYVISHNNIVITEEGIKNIDTAYQVNHLEWFSNNLFVIQVDGHFAFMHVQEFLFRQDQLMYLNEQFTIKILDGRRLIALTEESFEFLDLLDYATFLDEFVKNMEFRKAMSNGIRILKGELTILKLPISKSDTVVQLNEFFQKLAFTYCLFLIKYDKNKSKEALLEVVTFLIYTDNTPYLFTIIKDLLESQQLIELFDEVVQDLIKLQQIQYLPDEYLYSACLKYKATKNVNMITHLVNSLNLEQVETAIIVKVCDDMQLDDDLLYVCQMKRDYVTPIAKLLGREIMSNRCFDYIAASIQGRTLNGDRLNEIEYSDALKNIVQFLFVSENLSKFLEFRYQDGLNIIYQLFSGKACKCIQMRKSEISIRVAPQFANIEIFSELAIEYQIHRKMFLILRSLINNASFAVFTGKLLLNNFPLNQDVAFTTVQSLIQYYEEWQINFEHSEQLKNQFLLRVMMTQQFNDDQYDILLSYSYGIQCNSMAQVYLYTMLKQYGKAFSAFLKITSRQLQDYVFHWLQALLITSPQILEEQNEEFIIVAVKHLVQIQHEKAYKFIEKHLYSKHYAILTSLDTPELQDHFINYMTYLFSNKSKLYMINDQTKILYLSHLCKTQPKQVLEALKTIMFPLDEALKLTIEYKIPQAQAHIYTITGAIQSALAIYTALFVTKLKKCIKLLLKGNEIKARDYDKLDAKLQNLIDLIVRSQLEDISHSSLWYQFLDQFFKENKLRTFSDPRIPKSIKQLLCHYLSKLLVTMAEHLDITEMFEKLNTSYGELPIQVLRQTINTIRTKFEDEYKQCQQISIIFANEQCPITDQLIALNQSAWVADHECHKCHESITSQAKIYIFHCRHTYHESCLTRGYAKIPYCSDCNDEITNKVITERVFRQYQLSQQLTDAQLTQYVTTNIKQQHEYTTSKDTLNKKDILRRFDNHKLKNNLFRYY